MIDINIKEGALIFEKKISKNIKSEKIMFCSENMTLEEIEKLVEYLKSKGLEPFIENNPKYGACIVLKREYFYSNKK